MLEKNSKNFSNIIIMYLKYLEDNLNEKFTKNMDEYRKYSKLFYADRARCPANPKILLEKKRENKIIELWCKSWRVIVKEPVIINLNYELTKLLDEYKNQGLLFKSHLRQNMKSGIYNPDKDAVVEKMLKELKNKEAQIDGINEVLNKEKEMIDEIIAERQEVLKVLAEIKVKKSKVYKNCKVIDNTISIKLKEISKNEKDVKEQRLIQISKNVGLTVDEVRAFLDYYNLVMDYLKQNSNLHNLNMRMIGLKEKFEKINDHFIIEPPEIKIEGEKKKK